MKPAWLMLLVPFALAACAVDPTPESDVVENVDQAESELKKLDDSTFCLPGEEVKCTLGPPPVCKCVPKKAPPIGPIAPILAR
ncbi:MAG: hypothetical protein KF819_40195 [Labilithrix sp.]|nr:hypothetical protein [Labilithrix sp.]